MLEISRADVIADEIIELPADKRFIKLPVIPYLKLLPAPPPARKGRTVYDEINRPQIAVINALNMPKYRFICAALSRRLGKTFIANIIAQLVMLVPGCNILIMSPNYNLSSISFDLQRNLIAKFDLEKERDNLKDKILELSNGSTVRMGSISTVDSSVGRSYDLIIFDEAALASGGKEAFNISLRPTLDRPGAKAIFISTPRGKNNWFSEFFFRGFSDEYPEWCSIRADYHENTRMSASDVAEAKKSMSKNEFEQEYMASFNSYEGMIYEITDDLLADFVHEDGCEYFAGLDPGFRDPTAFAVIAYNSAKDYFHIIDEYQESERTTPEHAVFLKELIGKHNIETIFIDSAAPQFASDLAYIHDIATIKAKKDVLPGINYIQGLIEQKRLKIAPHCVKTLAAFDQYQWDQRETLQKEKPAHGNSHLPDAVRYGIYTYTI